MDLLSRLSAIKRDLATALHGYRRNHALWAKWLHYAKTQPWYDDWCFEQTMRQSDLKADPRYISKEHTDIKPDLKYEAGALYYLERHSLAVFLDQLRLQRSNLLHDLWVQRNSDGSWTYSLAEIAKAYGNTDTAMYKLLNANEWFFARRNLGQTHIPKNYLKAPR